MANTYIPIATVTVGSGGSASIDFTNIPQTYTDLHLLVSIREETSATAVAFIRFNNTTTNRSERYLQGNGSSAVAGTTTVLQFIACQPSDTANTFGNASIYIPNYTSSRFPFFCKKNINLVSFFFWLFYFYPSDSSNITVIRSARKK